jgi:energy-coupling factor transporter ATP-binding protein EcfA2
VDGLAAEGIIWIRTLMRSLAEEGRTIFVSSHLMSEMPLTADHLLVIELSPANRSLERRVARPRAPNPASEKGAELREIRSFYLLAESTYTLHTPDKN